MVKLENGKLTIEFEISALPQIVEGAWATGNLNPRLKITDWGLFAQDLCRELSREDESGSTCVHYMMDKAIQRAIEGGADGITEHETQNA